MKTMNTTSRAMATTTSRICHQTMAAIRPIMPGMPEMMLANRIRLMPLPMPNSVICSPSHMMAEAPAV